MDRGADPLIGRVLDSRYRIEAKIAHGGMSTVYEGQDLRLGRSCAIKVMRADLGDDATFRERFVREAQAAARLSDPHVVNIYDQGDDHGLLYLVMEFVAGQSLREVIRDEAPMRPERALELLEPVLQALAAAHSAGIIHCDVKPENVLISTAGTVKVVDFGLARAFDAHATHTATGLLMGTASYLAPERIEGSTRITPRVDVYAAGVVLYELLTGRKPHEGEGPVQIAFKHVHEDVPPPSKGTGLDLPAYVDALVVRATSRDAVRRQADAKVFLHQARRVRAALAAGDLVDAELTADLLPPPVRDAEDSIDYTAETPALDAESTDVFAPLPRSNPARPAPPLVMPRREATAEDPPPPDDRPRRSRRGPILLIVALLVVAVAAYAGWWLGFGRYTVTPGVLNLSESVAQAKVEDAGLKFAVSDRTFSETVPSGSVISTDPKAGSQILKGGTVTAIVSQGPERYQVPDLRGMTLDEATAALQTAHLAVGEIRQYYNPDVPEGQVIRTMPARDTEQRLGTPVDLNLSKGRRPIAIPDLTGKDATKAEAKLTRLGFKVTVTEENSDTVDKGRVIAQDPRTGTGFRDDVITLTVSKGPVLVSVPNVRALSVADATASLAAVGLKIAVERSGLYVGLDTVVAQNPKSGELLPKGSVVTVQIV